MQVLPQLIARINVGESVIRDSLHSLLLRIGMAHPQVWSSIAAYEAVAAGCKSWFP